MKGLFGFILFLGLVACDKIEPRPEVPQLLIMQPERDSVNNGLKLKASLVSMSSFTTGEYGFYYTSINPLDLNITDNSAVLPSGVHKIVVDSNATTSQVFETKVNGIGNTSVYVRAYVEDENDSLIVSNITKHVP